MYIFYYFAAAIAFYVLYKVTGVVSDRRKSCALGCKPGHLQKNRLPLGLDQLLRLEKADKEGLITEEFVKIFAEEGRKTFTTNFLGSTVVRTSEPENLQALLATQFPDFVLGPLRRNTMFPLLGRGIFTSDGEACYAPPSLRVERKLTAFREHTRAILRPQFTRQQVADLELEENHVQELLRILQTNQHGWTEELNIAPLFSRLTFDTATEFFFGTSLHSQRQSAADPAGQGHDDSFQWGDLGHSFDLGIKHLGDRDRLLEFYWLHNPKEFRDCCRDLHAFADHCVQKALAKCAEPKQAAPDSSTRPKYVFLDEMVKVTKDPIELRGQLMNVLIAGRDTTASLLS